MDMVFTLSSNIIYMGQYVHAGEVSRDIYVRTLGDTYKKENRLGDALKQLKLKRLK